MFCYSTLFNIRGELINEEESKSKELLSKVINKINVLENGIIKKIQIIDKDSMNLNKSISKAVTVLISELESEILKSSFTYPGACSRYLPLKEVGVLRMLAIG